MDGNTNWSLFISTTISLAGIVISIIAAGILCWQLYVQRRHNRLSVKPHLNTWLTRNNPSYDFCLMNNGLGPAQIERFEIYVDGKKVDKEREEMYESAFRLIFPKASFKCTNYAYLNAGYAIPAGKEITLYGIEFKEGTPTDKEFMETINIRVSLNIHYRSFYDDEFIHEFRQGKTSTSAIPKSSWIRRLASWRK
jgi:hypothetical protein